MTSADYDLGYYEGIRNCIHEIIRRPGIEIKVLLEVLVALREEAKELVDND